MTTTTHSSTIHTGTGPADLDVHEAPLAYDMYREIHKGLRFALFHTTLAAGTVDVADDEQLGDLLDRCTDLVALLRIHHQHEDEFLDPLVREHDPVLAELVDRQHVAIEAMIEQLVGHGRRLATAARDERGVTAHRLYLELTRLTARYLEHQLVEETQVMAALCRAVPVEELEAIHGALRGSIPPDVLADIVEVMMPAMSPEERAGMLGGMVGAPPVVFEPVRRAAQRSLTADEFAGLLARIEVR